MCAVCACIGVSAERRQGADWGGGGGGVVHHNNWATSNFSIIFGCSGDELAVHRGRRVISLLSIAGSPQTGRQSGHEALGQRLLTSLDEKLQPEYGSSFTHASTRMEAHSYKHANS